jgi:hypothetical protein
MPEHQPAHLTRLDGDRYLVNRPERDLMDHAVSARDWDRIRTRVAAIKQPSTMWSTAAGVFAGVGVTGFISAVTSPRPVYEAAFYALGISGVIAAVLCVIGHFTNGRAVTESVDGVLKDMDDVVSPDAALAVAAGRVAEEVEEVLEASAATTGPELRENVEQLGANLRRVQEKASRPRRSPGAIDELIRDVMKTKATRTFNGRSSLKLKLHIASDAETFQCTVKTPHGSEYSAMTRRSVGVAVVIKGISDYAITYPDEFPDAEPLIPGHYEVEWRTGSSSTARPPSLAALIGGSLQPPVATDAFTIPAG